MAFEGESWIQAIQREAQGNRLPIERLLGRDVPIAAGQVGRRLERVHEAWRRAWALSWRTCLFRALLAAMNFSVI